MSERDYIEQQSAIADTTLKAEFKFLEYPLCWKCRSSLADVRILDNGRLLNIYNDETGNVESTEIRVSCPECSRINYIELDLILPY